MGRAAPWRGTVGRVTPADTPVSCRLRRRLRAWRSIRLSSKRALTCGSATAELLAALVEVAIAHGRRYYSESGEPLATTLAVLECPQREGFVAVDEPET